MEIEEYRKQFIDDIDMDAVADYAKLVGYGKSPLQYLRENNGFVTTNKKGEEDVSTACVLLFGKNPQKFFPRVNRRLMVQMSSPSEQTSSF